MVISKMVHPKPKGRGGFCAKGGVFVPRRGFCARGGFLRHNTPSPPLRRLRNFWTAPFWCSTYLPWHGLSYLGLCLVCLVWLLWFAWFGCFFCFGLLCFAFFWQKQRFSVFGWLTSFAWFSWIAWLVWLTCEARSIARSWFWWTCS